MKRFWNWVRDETDPAMRTLRLEGAIAEESWLNDEVTPAAFKDELMSGSGPITVWINSPGGDCIAAAQIYNMLMDYPADVTVRIDGIAASAASVIAMAGTTVQMSPVSMMMIHNPMTAAIGDSEDMRRAIQLLDEVKESIINSYEIKTGLSRARLSHLMDNETWMNAKKAYDLGFCDEILYQSDDADTPTGKPVELTAFTFSTKVTDMQLMNKLREQTQLSLKNEQKSTEIDQHNSVPIEDNRVKVSDLEARLALLRY